MVYRMIFNQTAYFGRGAIKEIPGVALSLILISEPTRPY